MLAKGSFVKDRVDLTSAASGPRASVFKARRTERAGKVRPDGFVVNLAALQTR